MDNGNSSGAAERANRRTAKSKRVEGEGAGNIGAASVAGAGIAGAGGNVSAGGSSGKHARGNGTDAGTSGGNGKENRQDNKSPVNPVELAGDTSVYQTDAGGNVIYKADGTPAKKRGRKPGQVSASQSVSGAKPKAKNADANKLSMSVAMLAQQFQLLNTCVAYVTQFDDFKLSDGEAEQLAASTATVLEQFDFTPDPKVAAVMGLVTTASMIYGPRIYLYKNARTNKKEKKAAEKIERADEATVKNISGAVFHSNNFVQ